ncbi:sialic acid-binding Ig-like lectin 8 isoform X3 [Cavia porcellus]|uniref:sialic acid-binding Ig-like lectin 8 isoform X3 n=1 Tax=Cavia porcellus TaxID=10141 RepID=UPI00066192C9|nr:sialic acid-binding Ig-like lectin 8 isoform X1 [Cavia porcellus]
MQLHPDLLLLLPLQALLLLLWAQEGASLEAYYLEVNSSVTVQKGLCVHVPCKFTYRSEDGTRLGPVYGYWYRYPDRLRRWSGPVATNDPERQVWEETRGRFLLTGDPEDNNCSLDIRYAKKKDEGSFYFRLEKGNTRYSYIDYPMSVRVMDLTHRPNILISGTLVSGRPSNLTCSASWACEQGTPPMFSWVGASVSHLHPTVTSSPVLTLTPRPQDHRTNLTCQVTLPGVSVTRRTTVHLSVSYPPQNLTVTIMARGASSAPTALENGSSLLVLEGQVLRLLCAVDSHPPARLTWSWGNLILCPSEPANPGVLELTPEDLRGEGKLTCRAQNSLGSQHILLNWSLPTDEEEPPPRGTELAGVTLGAIAGAGAATLFFLLFCIIFVIAWSCRKKSSRPAARMRGQDTTSGSASQGPLVESQPNDSSSQQPPPSVAAPSSDEEEIHYASLSFHGMKPRDPQEHQSITSEYSEIKTHE